METPSPILRGAPRTHSWQQELAESLRTAADLVREGYLREEEAGAYAPVLERYGFLLPRYYARLIDRSDPRCPIRRQAIPDLAELTDNWGAPDPLSDEKHKPAPHVTHRYGNRVLLHLTPNCSMYCRYCFRKTLLNEGKDALFGGSLEEAYRYVENNRKISEVILSGGDPLMLSDAALASVLDRLAAMSHVKTVRFHSRVPVTLPARVTAQLAHLINGTRLSTVVVTHFNHPREVTLESGSACSRLGEAGSWLFNQSVLLQGVNDSAEILCELSRQLMSVRVTPYYLHHPDSARGTRHFWVSFQQGMRLYDELRSLLPGYLVPRYVVDDIERPYKTHVGEFLGDGPQG